MGEMKMTIYTAIATREGQQIRFQLKDPAGRIVAEGSGATVGDAEQDSLEKTKDAGAQVHLGQVKYPESLMSEIPQVGDTGVFKRADGFYEAKRSFTAYGWLETRADTFENLERAHTAAFTSLGKGGRVLYSHHADPEYFELYSARPRK